jgi:hypothetical protein
MVTACGGSDTTATGKRRRRDGTARMRGGTRNPTICMVAVRKFVAALSAALRTIVPKA